MQNLRRVHYEISVDHSTRERLLIAFNDSPSHDERLSRLADQLVVASCALADAAADISAI